MLVICSTDPHNVTEAMTNLDLPALGLDWTEGFRAHDLLTDEVFDWTQFNFVRLDPHRPAHIFAIERY